MNIVEQTQALWRGLAARERRGMTLAFLLVALAALWWGLVKPAWQIVQAAPAQSAQLQAQLQNMQAMQAQAQVMQSQPKLSRDDAARALESSVKELGSAAQLTVQGDRATLTLKAVSARALAQWLDSARVNARSLPTEAHLQRHATAPGAEASWDGSLLLALPNR